MSKSNDKAAAAVTDAEIQSLNSRMQETPIAIVGMASVFADATNLDQFWDNISEGLDSIIDVPKSRWAIDDYYSEDKTAADKSYCKRGGFMPDIDFDPMEFGLPPNILEVTDIAQLMSLVVAREVLNDAGIGEGSDYDRDKVGITLGVGGGLQQIVPLTARLQTPILNRVLESCGIAEDDRAAITEKFKKAYIPWEENSFPGMLGNVIAGRIANRFDFGGTNCVVDAACAGSLAAMKLAVSDLLEYRSEVMISGGVCCDNSPFMYMSFSKTPAFTTDDNLRPFDDESKGMMVGEGIGMIAMKRLEDAERDGDRVYAVLKGMGTSSDGRFKSIYAPRPDGQAKALKRAYDDAGFPAKTVGMIEAHGTGTMAGDASEFRGLAKYFGEHSDEAQHIALGSVKSQIGHTKSAAGSAGIIKVALALHHKVLPPTINIDKPSESLEMENTPFYLNTETRPWMPRPDGAPRRGGISSFGFGGTNYHFVMEEYKPEHTEAFRLKHVPETLILTADDEQLLKSELNQWRSRLDVDEDDKPYVFNDLVVSCGLHTPSADQVRVGFTAVNADDAIETIDKALAQLEKNAGAASWSTPSGISYRKHGLKVDGQVVALFSGQGSQYVNMGRDLACNFPTVMGAAAAMDTEFTNNGLVQLSQATYPIPVFSKEARVEQENTLRLTQHAQPAIGTFSVGLYKTLEQAGFKADFTAGHSFGELTALWAAGVLDDADYMMLARSRGQAMAAPDDVNFDAGTMVAVVGEPEKVAADIANIADVTIANYNSNNQVVVAGVTKQVDVAFDELKAKGYKVVKLPVSAAFHTPLVGHAQKPFAKAIDSAKFNAPKVPVFSNASGEAHSNKPKDIKAAMKNHILESVHFNKEIDNIYAAGGRVFVEFGPKNVLTKLVENILSDKDDVVAIALNGNPKKSCDLQFRQAAVQLAVLGLQLDDVDPYSLLERPTEGRKMSPMAMKLNAGGYVSPKTEKAFEDSLVDGYQVKGAASAQQPQVIEKIVEVEKIVEKIVEVPVYRDAPAGGVPASAPVAAASAASAASANSGAVVDSIERSVEQFIDHQNELLDVHEQFMEGPQDYARTVQKVVEAQNADQLPESVNRTLGMYHDFQTDTLRVHETYLNKQSENMSEMMQSVTDQYRSAAGAAPAAPVAKAAPATSAAPAQSAPAAPVAKAAAPVAAAPVAKPAAAVVKPAAPVAPAPVAAPVAAAPALDLGKIQKVMMDVVADKTGYPAEMLELEMDMEADLGIDSIKRVEILGSVQEEIPDLPELNPEDLAELRTLGEIVNYMQSKVPAGSAAPAAAAPASAGVDLAKIQQVMMSVVADKTGYPAEMLELEMDMEADLGIDSIKRVEILGAVQEEIPDLPELNPEDLAELRTLGQIVDYMQDKAGAAAPAASAPAAAPGIDLSHIQNVMMTVVADKTGYPAEMLELGMDMEADLGIDSIKRVEILGAVQEEIPDLPELNPEDLAELRTLGQIVDYMQEKAGASAPVAAAAAPQAAVATAPAASGIDLSHIQNVMMNVVADKTGYPSDMLELGMDMEADLGIDSIKRVEILGAVQEEIPNLPELNPEDLAELRTLGQIVEYMQSKAGGSAPAQAAPAAPAAGIDLGHIQNVMMNVVAEKTGYPSDMLELGMDMEADLGIDSIKRVEILGAVQEEIPNLPELNPEDLAELRTLGQIVEYMQSKAGGSAPAQAAAATAAAPAAAAPAAGVDVAAFSQALLNVVGEKTGYPVEMLELEMDMEADLGIDSIKRVEILGAVQDAMPGLPEVNPETLAEMRTLGEIVSTFTASTGEAPAASADVADFEPAPSAVVKLERLPSVTRIAQSVDGANALVVDDGTGAAIKLSDTLTKAGWNVTAIRPSWVEISSKKAFNKAVTLIELEALEEASVQQIIADAGQLDAVIYVHPKASIDDIEYPEASKQGLMLAFLLAKLCGVKGATKARASFLAVTRQGGTINIDEAAADLVQGGLNGLVKTLAQEWENVFCRAVDINGRTGADKVAQAIEDELLDADTHTIEVGYDNEGRFTLVGELTDSYALEAGNSIDADSVFLVSGGAKGVTAHCVIRLAKEYHSKFILLGRSRFDANEPTWAAGIADEAELKKAAMQALIAAGDKPTPVKVQQFIKPILANREIAGTLAAIEQAGGQAQYVSADVTNAEQMQAAVKPLIAEFGAITGLIHGAGVLADKFIEQKTLDDFNAVYRTKIDGLTAMLSCADQSTLKHLVLFSSAAGFYGNPGQSDYSIANEILNKTAYRFKTLHPQAQVLSFNWGPWDGGMVTPELKRMFAERGVYIIPLDAGAQLMLSELAAGDNRCPQILVGNDMGGEESEAGATPVKKPEVSRLVKRIVAANNPFLADHVIGGNQVLPTVCAMAWMRDAVLGQYPGFALQGIENYKLLKGIVFDGSEAGECFIDLAEPVEVNGGVKVGVKISSLNANDKPIYHYAGDIVLGKAQPQSALVAVDTQTANAEEGAVAGSDFYKNGTLFHGESLQVVQQLLRCNDSGLLLQCAVPESARDKQGEFPAERSNVFANDVAYQAMLIWVRRQFGMGSLPSATASWTVYQEIKVGQAFFVKLDVDAASENKLVANIQLVDEEGQLLADIKAAEVTISESLNDLFTPAA
ncbi:Phenolphthiocerol synthesis polyketide synthase type I Pks15/1 [BD1-7 clade bacterium]|uniref:Phenolphthiocerol synthesis polyketide synthase type I Pks15/1 n=1 Tax=BD1-7 clade bacterium TaxID=2029982 RepID=A0A5S9QYY9_9GAMM|nr:Phenolphthiocerol synthesis polyketide synthase type I Pks15/1 [BD1-7 clade bacterium]